MDYVYRAISALDTFLDSFGIQTAPRILLAGAVVGIAALAVYWLSSNQARTKTARKLLKDHKAFLKEFDRLYEETRRTAFKNFMGACRRGMGGLQLRLHA